MLYFWCDKRKACWSGFQQAFLYFSSKLYFVKYDLAIYKYKSIKYFNYLIKVEPFNKIFYSMKGFLNVIFKGLGLVFSVSISEQPKKGTLIFMSIISFTILGIVVIMKN